MIKFNDLAATKHVKFLMALEKQANYAYKYVMVRLIDELLRGLKKERLAKSDKLPKGWTSEVPQIRIDVKGVIKPTINRHLKALEWVLYGNKAGKEAIAAAEYLGLKGKVTPGLFVSSYLHSIDAQSKHFAEVTDKDPLNMPRDLIRASLTKVMDKTSPFFDEFALKLENAVVEAIKRVAEITNYDAMSTVMSGGHDKLHEMHPDDAINESLGEVNLRMDTADVRRELKSALKSRGVDWSRFTESSIGVASGIGAHQAMVEIHGREDENIKVALATLEDNRTCDVCTKWSKKNGEFILYNLSDFKPAGYNFGKKKKDWELSIPKIHFNCRCMLVYLAPGVMITPAGDIVKKT